MPRRHDPDPIQTIDRAADLLKRGVVGRQSSRGPTRPGTTSGALAVPVGDHVSSADVHMVDDRCSPRVDTANLGRVMVTHRVRFLAAVAAAASVALSTLVAAPEGSATTPPGGPVSDSPITTAQLLSGEEPSGLTKNARFAPGPDARRAPALNGTLRLAGATMDVLSDAANGEITNPVDGKDTTFFPDVRLSFFTVGQQLVPVSQDVIRNGVLPDTRSYWDVIVQPGRVWTEPGEHGWHRASFPFALVNSIEGETHTGIALFLYRGSHVSPVRFQVVQMTAPYDVPEYFSAWGVTAANFRRGVAHLGKLRKLHLKSEAARMPERPWAALYQIADPGIVDAFANYSDVIESAVVVDGKLFRTDCPTSAGPFPYCSDVRWGVWSVTKSAMLNVAMLRLAQKYGDWILDAPIARYVPQARTPSWSDVTIGDLANMASGHGPAGHPTCYLCDYTRWYLAPSEDEKTVQALDYPRFTEPGTLYNYRDQDAYLLGVAEEKLLQAQAGPQANIWDMVRNEVYRPLGIYQAPTNMTIEPGSVGPQARGHAMLAYGYYPTLDDLAKIAALYQNHGAWNGHQILNRSLVNRLLARPSPAPQALPGSDDGSHWYLTDWHIVRIESTLGCTRYIPQMEGWGGNTVTVLPGNTTLIRMRNNWVGDPSDPQVEINALADELSPVCGEGES
jgi:hypothetical protein